MSKNHKALGYCLTLALFMAVFSNAQAATVVIDPFDDGDQIAGGLGNTVDSTTAIGGKRFMQATGETLGGVDTTVGTGFQFGSQQGNAGGYVTTIWNGGSTLGGADLTDGGANSFFEIDVNSIDPGDGGGRLELYIADSGSNNGSILRSFEDLSIGSNLFAFADLPGAVNPASVDEIRLIYALFSSAGTGITIDSFSAVGVVPVPAAAWLFGSGLIGLVGIARRRKA